MELNEIEFGFYKEGEETQILDLFHRVFPKIPRTLKEWEWEYRESPFSPPIIAIARAGGKVIGQEALFYVPMKFKEKSFHGAQSVDTMTDPDFRGKGVFGRLARLTLEEGMRRNTPLFYGFPNRNSYSAYVKKLNWIDVTRVQRFIKVLDLPSALKARIKNPAFRKLLGILGKPLLKVYFWGKEKRDSRFSLHQVEKFGEDYEQFWGELRGRFPLMVDRTSTYMNWRYIDHPSGEYRAFFLKKAGREEIFGVAVLHMVDLEYRLGSIGEFFVKDWDPEVGRVFLTLLLDYFKLQGTAIVATWTLSHSPFVPVFKVLGFRLRSQHQSFIVVSPDGSLEREEIGKPENWFISSGDYDMF